MNDPQPGAPAENPAAVPFVETRGGALFFLNAVLAAPALLLLWPILLRAALRAVGVLTGPSAVLDPVPDWAAEIGPWVAWVSALPLATTLINLRMALPGAARWALRAFAAVHGGLLVWWAIQLLR